MYYFFFSSLVINSIQLWNYNHIVLSYRKIKLETKCGMIFFSGLKKFKTSKQHRQFLRENSDVFLIQCLHFLVCPTYFSILDLQNSSEKEAYIYTKYQAEGQKQKIRLQKKPSQSTAFFIKYTMQQRGKAPSIRGQSKKWTTTDGFLC